MKKFWNEVGGWVLVVCLIAVVVGLPYAGGYDYGFKQGVIAAAKGTWVGTEVVLPNGEHKWFVTKVTREEAGE